MLLVYGWLFRFRYALTGRVSAHHVVGTAVGFTRATNAIYIWTTTVGGIWEFTTNLQWITLSFAIATQHRIVVVRGHLTRVVYARLGWHFFQPRRRVVALGALASLLFHVAFRVKWTTMKMVLAADGFGQRTASIRAVGHFTARVTVRTETTTVRAHDTVVTPARFLLFFFYWLRLLFFGRLFDFRFKRWYFLRPSYELVLFVASTVFHIANVSHWATMDMVFATHGVGQRTTSPCTATQLATSRARGTFGRSARTRNGHLGAGLFFEPIDRARREYVDALGLVSVAFALARITFVVSGTTMNSIFTTVSVFNWTTTKATGGHIAASLLLLAKRDIIGTQNVLAKRRRLKLGLELHQVHFQVERYEHVVLHASAVGEIARKSVRATILARLAACGIAGVTTSERLILKLTNGRFFHVAFARDHAERSKHHG